MSVSCIAPGVSTASSCGDGSRAAKRRPHAWPIAALVAFAAALGATSQAHAVTQRVNFDALPAEIRVTDQYRDLGGPSAGVVFGPRRDSDQDGPGPLVQSAPHLARSAPNVGGTICASPPEFSCINDITYGQFLTDQSQPVTLYVGAMNATSTRVTFRGYTLAGELVDSDSVVVSGDSRYDRPLTITPATGKPIVFFEFARDETRSGSSIGFDDLTFETPSPGDPPPPPRFGLAPAAGTELGLIAPGSVETEFIVQRRSGSSGALSFSVEGLPPGITPSFAPGSPTAAARIKLTLAVAANAPLGSFPITVRARPVDASVSGAGAPDTLALRLEVRKRADARVRGIEVTQGVQFDNDDLVLPRGDPPVQYAGVPLAAHGKTIVRVYADAIGGRVTGQGIALYGYRGATQLPESPLIADAPAALGPLPAPRYAHHHPLREIRRSPKGAFTLTLPDSWTRVGRLSLEAKIVPSNAPIIGGRDPLCDTPACVANDSFRIENIGFQQPAEPTGVGPPGLERRHLIRLVALYTCVSDPTERCGNPRSPRYPDDEDVFDATASAVPVYIRDSGFAGALDITDITQLSFPDLLADAICPLPPAPLAAALPDICNLTDQQKNDLVAKAQNAALTARVNAWSEQGNVPAGTFLVAGVNKGFVGFFTYNDNPGNLAIVDQDRPMTSVTHEFGHALDLRHAGLHCGGNDNGQIGEPWPPDDIGYLRGVGLDRRVSSGGSEGPYRIIAERPELFRSGASLLTHPNPGNAYDAMSYCAGSGQAENQTWISPRNWIRMLTGEEGTQVDADTGRAVPPGRAQFRRTQAQGGALHVQGFATSQGVFISDVTRTSARPAPADSSAFRLVARNADGGVVADVPMRASEGHIDRGGSLTTLEATVPVPASRASLRQRAAARVESVEIRSGQSASLPRTRSAQAPTVRFLAPRRGARVGRTPTTTVRWRARDADSRRLTARLDYSSDDGRRWRSVFVGPDRGRALVPSRMLARSRRARLRLRVNDGFNETERISPRFVALGAPPSVELDSPGRGERLRQDATVYLSGSASDDTFRSLRGRQLVWFVGRKRVGYGETVSVTGLPAGRPRIRLVARDRFGRRSTAAVTLRVAGVQPRFLELAAPQRVARRARRLNLRVASTFSTTLRVRGRRYRVERKARRITIPIRPGRAQLRLQLRLGGGRYVTRTTLLIGR